MIRLERKFEDRSDMLGSNYNNRGLYPINGQNIIYIGARYFSKAVILTVCMGAALFAL